MIACHIVRDLLPLYVEHLTSAETDAEVARHLEDCGACREILESMDAKVDLEKAPIPKMNFLKKLRRKQLIGAVLSLAVSLFCMVGLYNLEFSVDVTNTVSLEAAIDEYFFTEDVNAKILNSQRVGNELIVFFNREGYSGHTGTATLERGILGKYRFLRAGLSDWPLYSYSFADASGFGKRYLQVCGLYDLPGVASYAIYSAENPTLPPIYEGKAEKAPFMQVIPLETEGQYGGIQWMHYYDADGNELDFHQLLEEVPEPAEGTTPGVGSAELGLIYFYLAIVALLGWVFVRYFLKP